MQNLWPEITVEDRIETPRNILQEQAKYLSQQTKNTIIGQVGVGRTGEEFLCEFSIISPPLGYSTRLFSVRYRLIDIYPAEFAVDADLAKDLTGKSEPARIPARDRDEFVALLSRIFSADSTTRILKALKQHLQ